MKSYFGRLWVVVFSAVCVPAMASQDAWWVLCDSCTTDTNFEFSALAAPGNYSIIYVSNRDTNETRKFNRDTLTDDWGDGLQQVTTVSPLYLGHDEAAVFTAVIDRGNRSEIILDRSELGGSGAPSSVVGDIFNGSIDSVLLNSIVLHIELEDYFPDHDSVNRGANVGAAGFSGGGESGWTNRRIALVIKINFLDGSYLEVRRRPSDGKFVSWIVKDADGNRIAVSYDPNPNIEEPIIDPSAFIGSEFEFDAAHESDVIDLADFITDETSATCTTTRGTRPDGTEVIRVTCIQ